jgi:hypothetical protein
MPGYQACWKDHHTISPGYGRGEVGATEHEQWLCLDAHDSLDVLALGVCLLEHL